MAFKLTISNISSEVFESYWYCNGKVESITEGDYPDPHALTYVVNYGEDRYQAECQASRFASGLYFARVEEVLDRNSKNKDTFYGVLSTPNTAVS